jgi:hypothetical protein
MLAWGAPRARSQGPCSVTGRPDGTCPTAGAVTASTPQPAGVVAIQNSSQLTANLPATVTCPAGHFDPTGSASNGSRRSTSYPQLYNNVIWQNRTFNISVGGLGTGALNQQNVGALVPTLNQLSIGACVSGANYWDIGVRGDMGQQSMNRELR